MDRYQVDLIKQARARAKWCEQWANRPDVKRPQITPEWKGLIDDVRRLSDELERSQR